MEDAIDHAKNGKLKFFKEAQLDILLNARDSDGGTVLSIVVNNNHADCCKEICERCPSLLYHQARHGGNTPLHIAASKGYLDILKILISTCDKADQEGDRAGKQKTLTLTDNEGQNFFHHAVKFKQVKMVNHILGMKDITSTVLSSPDNSGRTPWDLAAASQNKSMISSLHEDGRVDKKLTVTKNLQWVVEKQDFVVMNMFMKTNADLLKNIELEVFENSKDILFKAAEKNQLFLCEELYKRCPSLIYHQTTGGRTALHHAVWRGTSAMVKFLIAAGAESYEDDIQSGGGEKNPQKLLTMVDDKGHTALHKAVLSGKVEALKLLVEADPNNELLGAGDLTKNTALHLAVGKKSNYGIARLLIEADPDFAYGANSDRKTPLLIAIDKAELHNDREMLKLILELQPTQSEVSVNENGWRALHYCVSRKLVDTIGYIIQSCPESSKVADNVGQNFFHHAVKSGNVELVKHILGMKEITQEVLNSTDNLGRTPWNVAAASGNEIMILCLHEDPRVNKKLMVTKNLNWVVEKHNFVMMKMFLEINADFLMKIELGVFQTSIDENSDTILFKAAQENQLFLCEELYRACPSLIYHQSKDGRTALHHAAWKGELIMLKFLIAAGAKSYNDEYAEDDIDIESGGGENIPQKMLLTIIDDKGDTALHKAVLNHKLEAVKLLVEANPDYEYRANKSGETPIMISIREVRSNENKFDSGEIRRLLFKMQPRQTVSHRGGKSWTSLLHQATSEEDLSIIEDIMKFTTGYLDVVDINGKNFLHIAAELGKIEVVRMVLRTKDIIKFCPSCLEQLDNEGKNLLHIAAEFEKVEIVKQVLRVKDIPKDGVLNKKDQDGNTPFHIAALTGNEPLTRCFLFDDRIIKTTVNKKDQHVLSAIKFPYDKRTAGVVDIAHTVDQSDLKDQSDFDLVVVALIATVSFTAGITVPGGYISDGPNQGTAVFSKEVSFATFIISNTFALIFSFSAVFSHFCARHLTKDKHVIFLLNVAKGCALAAMYCMMAAFIAGSFAVLGNSNWLAIAVCTISCLFFIFACGLVLMIVIQRNSAARASQHNHSA